MVAHVEIEEIQTTKSEKLLAVVLALFLFVGGIWGYQEIDDSIRAAIEIPAASPADQSTLDRAGAAQQRVLRAHEAETAALELLTIAREAYRTELDAGRPAPDLERRYQDAESEYAAAQDEVAAAEREAAALEPAAAAARQRVYEAQEAAYHKQALLTLALRLVLAVGALAAGYLLLGRLRRRGSRYLPLALAWVGAAAVLALVLAGDYVTDYVDPLELGPLVLSAVGVAMTVAAFAALQRYLARRVPFRRVRKEECPFCGYPARGGEHCEGCGRQVVADCSQCAAPRRVGTLHCRACGQA
jgi:predicted DCC family thiol-disulfide oxidoreductase YuxK